MHVVLAVGGATVEPSAQLGAVRPFEKCNQFLAVNVLKPGPSWAGARRCGKPTRLHTGELVPGERSLTPRTSRREVLKRRDSM